jgi:hypothetical protein
MAPRLKILVSSGSKKGTQIYYPFLSKVPAKKSLPGSPVERDTFLQNIFTSVLINLLISKTLRKERPSVFSKSRAPVETDAHSTAYLIYLLGFSVKEPSLMVPLLNTPRTENPPPPFLEPPFIHYSKSRVRYDMIYLLTAIG